MRNVENFFTLCVKRSPQTEEQQAICVPCDVRRVCGVRSYNIQCKYFYARYLSVLASFALELKSMMKLDENVHFSYGTVPNLFAVYVMLSFHNSARHMEKHMRRKFNFNSIFKEKYIMTMAYEGEFRCTLLTDTNLIQPH